MAQHMKAAQQGKQTQVASPVTTPTTTTNGTAAMNIPVKNGGGGGGQNGGVGGGVIISPRYKEFKTYSSTFDGLQALEQSQTSCGQGSSNNNTTNTEEQQHMVRGTSGTQGTGRRRRGC